ncbi:hypothetical protein [Pseudomonas sp. CCC3.1]|uniref:hypothetical protein n=1 Tax=Pseudomonas sp. CCC3.1 TaxID=3048607 RepID=UPI002AC988CB|nr:hypothetical protein [Pseudomonas sp. CCC3.1]MEB0207658.1 hypothetical protein [Pseudomonas sp. CCC3.1]WPX35730.1 hypothetical protein RHM56_20995 [Pseudomonas sp. CCC3.1]
MRKKILLGNVSPHDLPFSLRSDYVWTICVYALAAGGTERLLLETHGYYAIPAPWTFAFHLDDDESHSPAEGYKIRVEVLDKQVLIADASEQFSIDWLAASRDSVHNLVLEPRAI